jgi:hypothetical protein
MAARIQADINAPCKEKKRIPSVTVEQQSPEPASQSRPQRPELARQEGSSATPELPPPCLEQRTNLSAAMVEAKTITYSRRPKSRARSAEHDSDDAFSFTSFMHAGSETETDLPRARKNRSKRPRLDAAQRRSHTQSPHLTTEITSTAGANLLSETSTDITTPDIGSNNNNNTDVDEGDLSENDRKQRLTGHHSVTWRSISKTSNEHWTIGKALLTRSWLPLASHNRFLRILSRSWRKKILLKIV